MSKPELLVTPTRVEDIDLLAKAGADAFLIGEQRYGLRLPGEFNRQDVERAIKIAHENDKKVYLAMNAIFHNDRVAELADYVTFLQDRKVDAIVCGDPAVLMTIREVAPEMNWHWNTETTATNWFTCNYWGRKGAKRAVLSREISLDEIVEIKEHAKVAIEVQVHGMVCMFQSKRRLLKNYFQYQGKKMEVITDDSNRQMFLYDEERDNKYPIFEDENGTHIMGPNDICVIDELDELFEAKIDSFKIDGLFKTTDYLVAVTALYRQAIDAYAQSSEAYEEIKDELYKKAVALQPKNRPVDTGFFFKETVY